MQFTTNLTFFALSTCPLATTLTRGLKHYKVILGHPLLKRMKMELYMVWKTLFLNLFLKNSTRKSTT